MDKNLLTQELLASGYTADNHPLYVRWDNTSKEFTYFPYYVDELTLKLPCGLHAKGKRFFREMGYCGVDYCFENNNPVFICPYGKDCCQQTDALRDCTCRCFCSGSISKEEYSYEHSIEKKDFEYEQAKKESFEAFKKSRDGKVCENHCVYDSETNTWQQAYNPMKCISRNCNFCTLKGKEVSSERGNIFYDLESTWTCRDGSLFDGEETVSVTKGIPFFEKTHPLSILEDIVKLKSDGVISKVMLEKHYEMYIFPVVYRVQNITAKKKVTRDLLADLEDVAAGKDIIHESDRVRSEKEWKKKNKQLREEKAKKRLIKMLMDGNVPTETYSADYKHMVLWFSKEQIEEYIHRGEEMRKQKEDTPSFEQLTIFD